MVSFAKPIKGRKNLIFFLFASVKICITYSNITYLFGPFKLNSNILNTKETTFCGDTLCLVKEGFILESVFSEKQIKSLSLNFLLYFKG